MENQTVQEKFDALVVEHGAESVIQAIKSHVSPNTSGTCPQTACPKGYYCASGQCLLDVGR